MRNWYLSYFLSYLLCSLVISKNSRLFFFSNRYKDLWIFLTKRSWRNDFCRTTLCDGRIARKKHISSIKRLLRVKEVMCSYQKSYKSSCYYMDWYMYYRNNKNGFRRNCLLNRNRFWNTDYSSKSKWIRLCFYSRRRYGSSCYDTTLSRGRIFKFSKKFYLYFSILSAFVSFIWIGALNRFFSTEFRIEISIHFSFRMASFSEIHRTTISKKRFLCVWYKSIFESHGYSLDATYKMRINRCTFSYRTRWNTCLDRKNLSHFQQETPRLGRKRKKNLERVKKPSSFITRKVSFFYGRSFIRNIYSKISNTMWRYCLLNRHSVYGLEVSNRKIIIIGSYMLKNVCTNTTNCRKTRLLLSNTKDTLITTLFSYYGYGSCESLKSYRNWYKMVSSIYFCSNSRICKCQRFAQLIYSLFAPKSKL
uniref:RNA polymerase beta' subunit n=1 Tax=Equisetum scirpoides TaxID=3261 RepID=UPI0030FECA21